MIVPKQQNYQIWNIEIATYKRELERYGSNNIENSELFFFLDSQFVINYIIGCEEEFTKLIKLVSYVEGILSSFEFKDKEKVDFLQNRQRSFKNEFNADKKVIKELNNSYKKLRREYERSTDTI